MWCHLEDIWRGEIAQGPVVLIPRTDDEANLVPREHLGRVRLRLRLRLRLRVRKTLALSVTPNPQRVRVRRARVRR